MRTITVRRLAGGDFTPETDADGARLAGLDIARPDRKASGADYPILGPKPAPVAGDRYDGERQNAIASVALDAGFTFTVLPEKAPKSARTDRVVMDDPRGDTLRRWYGTIWCPPCTGPSVFPGLTPETPKESAERVLSLAVRLLVETRKRLDAVVAPANGYAERNAYDSACGAVGTALDAAKDVESKHALPVYRDGYVITYDDDGEVKAEKCRVD